MAAAPAGFGGRPGLGHRGDNRGLRAVVAESGASHDHVGPGRATAAALVNGLPVSTASRGVPCSWKPGSR